MTSRGRERDVNTLNCGKRNAGWANFVYRIIFYNRISHWEKYLRGFNQLRFVVYGFQNQRSKLRDTYQDISKLVDCTKFASSSLRTQLRLFYELGFDVYTNSASPFLRTWLRRIYEPSFAFSTNLASTYIRTQLRILYQLGFDVYTNPASPFLRTWLRPLH